MGSLRLMKNANGYTPAKKKKFLDALSNGATVAKAANIAKVSRSGINKHRNNKKNKLFAEAWLEAVEAGTDAMEDEADRRGRIGWDEPVWYKGEIAGVVRKYSDTLLIFMLKARRPDKFRERTDVNVTGDITVKVVKFANGSNNTK